MSRLFALPAELAAPQQARPQFALQFPKTRATVVVVNRDLEHGKTVRVQIVLVESSHTQLADAISQLTRSRNQYRHTRTDSKHKGVRSIILLIQSKCTVTVFSPSEKRPKK